MKSNKKSNSLYSLSEQAFFILLSLSSGQKHGYAILKDVEDFSEGAVGQAENPKPGLPRKCYDLSETGRRVLRMETQRMQAIVRLAGQRLGGEV